MPRYIARLQPHKVCNPFYQPPGSLLVAIPLPYVSVLVEKHPRDLPLHVTGVAPNVPGADVDFPVDGEGYAVDVFDDQGDLWHVLSVCGGVLLEQPPCELCGGD
ncbi:hypothetical protein TorRG33x02_292240 [Trema orientale]|uniref:Uncharacterized protein n=1 Tax=Trema orientale TaxID=63057 RepID=A0A2P5CAK8_TREOI|nr:hypothetical protein TorRG33x02_292240 [Trema orientale]